MANLAIIDGTGAAQQLRADTTGGITTPQQIPVVNLQPISSVNPMPIAPQTALTANGAPVDRSAVTVANTSTTLIAANPNRKNLMIAAPQTAPVWVNLAGGAATANGTGCFMLAAGAIYESRAFVSSAAVSYWCATAGLMLAATEA